MPITSWEFNKTAALLKKAQTFFPLPPLPRGESYLLEMDNPALVAELLPTIQRTAPVWMPEVFRTLEQYLKQVSPRDVDLTKHPYNRQWQRKYLNWLQSLPTSSLPTIVAAPDELFTSDAATRHAAGIPPSDPSEWSSIVTLWSHRLQNLLRHEFPAGRYAALRPSLPLLMAFLTSPESYGVTLAAPLLQPLRPSDSPVDIVLPSADPRLIVLKAIQPWARVLAHELGHAVIPAAHSSLTPPLLFGTEPVVSGEFTNLVALRTLLPTVAQELLREHPSPALAKTLGYLIGGTIGDAESSVNRAAREISNLIWQTGYAGVPSATAQLAQAASLDLPFSLPKRDAPLWNVLSEEFSRVYPQANKGEPVAPPPENMLQTALSLVLSAPEIQKRDVDVRNADPVTVLQSLQAMRRNPDAKRLFEIALGSPVEASELKQALNAVSRQVPEVRNLFSYELIKEHMPKISRK